MASQRLIGLCEAIESSVRKSCKDKVSISFSGGIDSALVALLAQKYCDVELIAVGIPNAHDLEAAKSASKLIDMELKTIEVEPGDMVAEGLEIQKCLNLSPIEIEFMLPFWIVAKNSTNSILMCGQGADELFGGYSRFRDENAEYDLGKEVSDLIKRLPEREKKIAGRFGLELSCPYLSDDVVEATEKYSPDERIGKIGKETLRKAALEMGLPKEIANRKKKAAQYGSGSQKAIKSIMRHIVELEFEFESYSIANSVIMATEPENKGWVETKVQGNVLRAVIKAPNLGSLREATEDFMACVSVAEKVSRRILPGTP
ncbi:MAG: KEOPS complex subunit Pcc1 [Candidatus Thermoplasmatota archaeon]|nr:KEOPS complex subunit Pcc1 [Candidatus Thermoplasmatota archaeon]